MAGKKDDFDFDNDLGLGDFDDFGDIGFESNDVGKDNRKPITKITGSFVGGARMKLEDSNFRRRMIKESLPKGYGMALDDLGAASQTARTLYNTAAKEVRPAARELRNALRRVAPNAGKYVPKSLAEKLNGFVDAEERAASQEIDTDESQITLTLGNIFAQQAEHQAQKEVRDDGEKIIEKTIEKKRFETTAAILEDIRKSTSRQVAYQDSVNVGYQKKSLELQMRQYFVSRKLLESFQKYSEKAMVSYEVIAKNTGLPEFVKINQTEVAKQQLREQFIASVTQKPADFVKGLGKKLSERLGAKVTETAQQFSEAFSTATMALEMMDGEDGQSGTDLLAEMAGGSLIQKGASALAKPIKRMVEANPKLAAFGNFLQYFSGNKEGLLNNILNSDEGGWFGKVLRDLLGPGYKRDDGIQTSMREHLDTAAHFNIHTRKTITDVIPGWLSKIHQEIKILRTNDASTLPETFDWDTGSFMTTKALAERTKSRIFSKDAKEQINDRIDSYVEMINDEGDEPMSSPAQKAIRKILINMAADGVTFEPHHFLDNKWYSGVKYEVAEEIQERFKKMFGFSEKDQKFKAYSGDRSIERRKVQFAKSQSALGEALPYGAKEELLKLAKTGQLGMLGNLDGVLNQEGGEYGIDFMRTVDKVLAPEFGTGLSVGMAPGAKRFSKGGLVQGPGDGTSDSIDAKLSNGEFVLTADAVKKVGVDFLGMLNNLPGKITDAFQTAFNKKDKNAAGKKGSNLVDILRRIGEGELGSETTRSSMADTLKAWGEHGKNKVFGAAASVKQAVNQKTSRPGKSSGGFMSSGGSELDVLGDRIVKAIHSSDSDRNYGLGLVEQILASLENGLTVMDMGQMGDKASRLMRRARIAGKKARRRIRGATSGLSDMTLGELKDKTFEKVGDLYRGARSRGGMAMTTLKEFAGNTFDFGKTKLGQAYEYGKGLYEKHGPGVRDIFNAKKQKLIDKAQMLNGFYIDVNTGKVIKSAKDITGEVKNLYGETVITAAQFAEGLFDDKLKPIAKNLMDIAGNVIGGVKDRIKSMANFGNKGLQLAIDVITDNKDVYVKGEYDNPRLYAHKMRDGLYFDEKTLDPIRRFDDIKGPVLDNNANVILSQEDIEKGLVDRQGNPIKTLGQKAEAVYGAIKSRAGMVFNTAKGIAQAGIEKMKGFYGSAKDKIKGFFGKGEDGDSKALFSFMVSKDQQLLEKVTQIYDLLLNRIPEPHKTSKFDKDDDGTRDGSWQDRLNEKKDEDGNPITGAATAQNAPGGAAAGGMFSNAIDAGVNKVKEVGGGALSAIGGYLGSKLGMPKGGGLLGKAKWAGKGLFKGAMTAGRFALTKAAPLLLKGAVGLGGLALKGTAAVLGGIIGSPVLLTAAAVGAAAYGGYKLYKWFTKDDNYLTKLRLIQYGIDVEDDDQAAKINTFEALLMKGLVKRSGSFDIDQKSVATDKIMEIFDIKEGDEEALNKFGQWFTLRFKPIFLSHVRVLDDIKEGTNLKDVDKDLNADEKFQMVKRLKIPKASGSATMYMISPWGNGDDLEYNAGDVDDEYEDIYKDIEKLKKKEDKKGSSKTDKAKASSVEDAEKKDAAAAEADKVDKDVKAAGEGKKMMSMWDKIKAAGKSAAGGIADTLTGPGKAAAQAVGMMPAVRAGKWLYEKAKDAFLDDDKGKWVWPTLGRLSSIWGTRIHPITGARGMHKGIDIAAPEGTPILAAASGIITRREYSESYGNVIYIKHEDGKVTRYAHMARFEPGYKVGDPVKAGAVIGYVGNTGKSAGNHLHFEIRKDGAWNADTIDPVSFIRNKDAQTAKEKLEADKKAVSRGDNDVEDPADSNMEGVDTIQSTEVGKPVVPPEANAAKPSAGLDATVVDAKEKAAAAANQTQTQKDLQSEISSKNMYNVVNVLKESLKAQQSMDSKLGSIHKTLEAINKKTVDNSEKSDEKRGPAIANPNPGPVRPVQQPQAPAPIRVSNGY